MKANLPMIKSQLDVCGPATITHFLTPTGVESPTSHPINLKIKRANFFISANVIQIKNFLQQAQEQKIISSELRFIHYICFVPKKSPFKSIFTTLLSLLILWCAFFAVRYFVVSNPNNNLSYIPETSKSVIILNGRELLTTSAKEIIFNDDEELHALFEEKMSKLSEDFQLKGINFNSDIVLFEDVVANIEISGVLVNLHSESLFEDFMTKKKNQRIGFAVKSKVGLIVTLNDTEDELSEFELQILANSILNDKSKKDLKTIEDSKRLNAGIISVWQAPGSNSNSVFKGDYFNIKLDNDRLLIEGDFVPEQSTVQPLSKHLKPNGMHLQSSYIPTGIRDSLNKYVSTLGLGNAPIAAFDINYRGLEIKNEIDYPIIPDFDLLVAFDKEYSKETLIDSICIAIGATKVEGGIIHSDVKYNVSSIGPKELLISTSNHINFEKAGSNIFTLNGDLNYLTKVEASGLAKMMLEILSLYGSSKQLLASLEDASITIDNSNGNAHIKGSFEFKEGKTPTTEIIKFLFKAELIR